MRLLVTYFCTSLVCSLLAGLSAAKGAPNAPLCITSAIIGDMSIRSDGPKNGPPPAEVAWPTGATEWSGVSEAFLAQLVQTRLQRAARTAYLDAEAAGLGASVSTLALADRDSAAAIFAYLDSRQRYVEELRLQDLTVLPTGMRKSWNNGNSSFEMGILKARFEPTRAFLTVFVRLRLPSPDPNSTIKERELFFGADDVEFTRSGGLVGDFKLVLLGDFIQPVGNITLRFLGGLNRQSGATDNLTYVTISCEQIAALRVTADVILPRSLVVPIQPTGEVLPTGLVTGRISISAPRFPHFLTSVSLSPFAITGQEKFGFMVGGASLDLSDLENPTGFPASYLAQNPGDSPDNDPLRWRGVYVGALQVLLPSEFKERGKSQRLALGATNLILDRTGVSGSVQMTGIPLELTASGWAMSLRRFRLDFERSKLIGGGFGGSLTLPMAPQEPLDYNALIDSRGDYLCTLAPRESVRFNVWRAKAKLDRSSVVSLAVQNAQFRPQAVLNGTLGSLHPYRPLYGHPTTHFKRRHSS